MKNTHFNFRNLVFFFVTGIILAGCSKDKTATDNIVGTWTAGDATFAVTVGGMSLSQYYMEMLGLSSTEAQTFTNLFNQSLQQNYSGTIKFNADNTFTASMGGSTDSGTWSMNADGTQLTIDPSTDTPQTFDVIELTSSVLKIRLTDTRSEDLNDDGTDETISVMVDLTLNR